MTSFPDWRGHIVHFVIFGLPVLALVGAVGVQEVRARLRAGHNAELPRRDAPHGYGPAEPRSVSVGLASLGLATAAAIHAGVIRAHFDEDLAYGYFFLFATALQLSCAVALFVRPSRRLVRAVGAASGLILALYLVSRVTGLPIGPEPWEREAFGALDIAASAAELVTLIACVAQLRAPSAAKRRLRPRVGGVVP